MRLRLILLLFLVSLGSLAAGLLARWPALGLVALLDALALAWLLRQDLPSGDSTLDVETLYNQAPCGFHSLDADGRFLRINETALSWLGYRRDEVLGRPLSDFLAPGGRKTFDERFPRFKERGWVRDVEIQLVRKDGSLLHALLSAVALRDAGGRFIASHTAYVDITERKRSEERLAEVSGRLHAVLDAATAVAIIATDLEGRITLFNAGAERILGHGAAEMLGQSTPWELHPQEEREWTGVRKDGSPVTVHLVGTDLHDSAGQVSGYLTLATDVTDRHRAEEALRQARDTAQSANEAKSNFLASMSHEIRNPLGAIIGMVELLQQGAVSDEQRAQLRTLATTAETLLSLINDILDFSKIEAGKLELEQAPFDPRAVVADVVDVFSLPARRKGLTLASRVADDLPPAVLGDAGRLRQVLLNLVGNAIKFTSAGEVVVSVSSAACGLAVGAKEGAAKPQAAEVECMLHFEVRDTGIGIPPDQLERIFRPFEQAGAPAARPHGGTGLGLTISSRLVQRMGGTLQVRSEVGRGSVFSFQLRLSVAAAAAVPVSRGAAERGPALRILLAEDNPVNQQVLSLLLQRGGHQVEVAANGRLALEALERGPFDLVLMDLQMPEMDGLRATRLLRAREKATGGHVPVVAVTANALEGERERCLKAGMDEFLTKPVRSRELQAVIERVLGRRPALSSSPAPAPAEQAVPAWLLSLREMGFDGDAVARLARTFIETVPGRLETLARAVAERDALAVARTAHTLKGSLEVFSVRPATEAAARLERHALDRRLDAFPAALADLEAAVHPLVASMQEIVGGT